MKFVAFDIEIAKDISDNGDWKHRLPLGITCAAAAFSDKQEPIFWKGIPSMTRDEC